MYSLITSQMTWSYSRLSAFESCPYRFFMKYLLNCDEEPQFFSQFGSFVHEIHQLVFESLLSKTSAASYYVRNFDERVTAKAPSKQIFTSYFKGGLDYFKHMPEFDGSVLGIEKEFHFDVDGYPFVGFADLLTRTDQGLLLYDHKARALKPRSNKKKPTVSDQELDRYFRQLYLYSIPIKEEYGEYPKELIFNCYRGGYFIKEPFSIEKLENAKSWASGTIRDIIATQQWQPRLEFFKCKYLCGLENDCSYFSYL